MSLSAAPQLRQSDVIRRFCEDCLAPIDSLEEARRVLTFHAGHGARCPQYLAALSWASEVTA
ncbi:hypothetical protein B7C42_05331 [Nocardia cerradoensis]|uniref:Uncharacterized protein n=1 Tax=Nocardia cerradoensis TaxID=85688 RepID=A0A231H108_9NOCA|nr:hypothetical protein B7C42_05331 [Nocardia cerradoensis]